MSKAKLPTLLAAAGIVAVIKTAADHTKKGDQLIHQAAIQALLHAEKHGDPVYIDRLIKALGKSIRKEGLKFWVEQFSPVTWNGDGKIGIWPKTSKKYKEFDCAEAWANPFWTLEGAQEKIGKPLTIEKLLAMVEGLPDRLDKAVKDDKFAGNVTEAASLVNMLSSYAKTLNATRGDQKPANTDQKPKEAAKPRAPRKPKVVESVAQAA